MKMNSNKSFHTERIFYGSVSRGNSFRISMSPDNAIDRVYLARNIISDFIDINTT